MNKKFQKIPIKYSIMSLAGVIIMSLYIFYLSASNKKQSNIDTSNDNLSCNDNLNPKDNSLGASKLLMDTLTIEGNDFIVFQSYPGRDTSCNLTIIDSKKDTVYQHRNYATNGFELEDFDRDGIMDIRMFQLSNIEGISELIMYYKTSKTFQEIRNFKDFANPKKIEHSEFWYSYQRTGCADVNWESKLFKMKNFKAIAVGEIDGIFCEHEPKKGIFIYKISGPQKIQIHSENKWPEQFQDRWEYLEDYWTKNYRKFE